MKKSFSFFSACSRRRVFGRTADTLCVVLTLVLASGPALRAAVTGGGVQPELTLHYPAGYQPVNIDAAASTLTFPANFTGKDLTALLHKEHPRLYATSEDWQRIRKEIPTNRYLTAARDMIVKGAENILPKPPLERVLIGRRILSISREVLSRVLTLSTAYRVTDDRRYFERARSELLHAAAFSDWNPSHFLDVTEMTMAMAIGYDWLYHDLSAADRITLRDAILEKGLKPGTGPAEAGTITYWKLKDNNWVQSCFGGMVGGALAIAEDKPDLAATFLREAFTHLHQALDAYAPDGAFPEGPAYWSFGTHYSVMLISMLRSSFGTAWNLENYPGFQASAVYMNEVMGPTGRLFNYSDGGEDSDLMPALHWFAAQAHDAALDAHERSQLLSAPQRFDGNGWEGRFFPLTLVWLDPNLPEKRPDTVLPLNWWGDGLNPIAILRSSWARDALFVGVKAGSPSNNHGHMDVGSFVLDLHGVRWALDFGAQDYNSLESLGMNIWGYKDQSSQRWDVFRINNFCHNTLVIDQQKQRVDGFAPIVKFSDDPKTPFAVMDLSAIYRESVKRALRGVRFLDDETVLVQDEIEGLGTGQSVRWGMATEAEVELHGDRAVLRLDGRTLQARIISPKTARFEIVQTDPPPHSYDAPNPGTRMLAAVVHGTGAPCTLRVVLSGGEITDSITKKILALPSLAQWPSHDAGHRMKAN